MNVLAVAGLVALVGVGCSRNEHKEQESVVVPSIVGSPITNTVPAASHDPILFPTDQQRLLETNTPGIYQPTASGRLDSALFGTVRISQHGKGLAASFHEGLDIAPVHRDRRGNPEDSVRAVADGTVAYMNRVVGNSNYGRYVVVAHRTTIGPVYTLYAHLARVEPGLAAGAVVRAGDTLALMGHSSSIPIPLERAHLHFEINLLLNSHYDRWYRAQKLKPDHGLFNGGNLLGMSPLDVFAAQQQTNATFTFAAYVASIPVAFEVAVATARPADYFLRYPLCWQGEPFAGRGIVVSAAENGLPVRGRNATEVELQTVGRKKVAVLKVNETVLGRNGCHLVINRRTGWAIGPHGEKWLEILMY